MEPVNPADQRGCAVAGSGIGAELRATLALAAPLAAANLAQMAMGVTDMVMVGRLGAMPLAATAPVAQLNSGFRSTRSHRKRNHRGELRAKLVGRVHRCHHGPSAAALCPVLRVSGMRF
jgi:hypothetical protein